MDIAKLGIMRKEMVRQCERDVGQLRQKISKQIAKTIFLHFKKGLPTSLLLVYTHRERGNINMPPFCRSNLSLHEELVDGM